MVNFNLIKQQKQAAETAQKSYEDFLASQKEIIKTLFKSLLREEYHGSTYISDVFFTSASVDVYLVIKNPVPTEQDYGLIFKFDSSDIDSISNSSELYYRFASGDKDYLKNLAA